MDVLKITLNEDGRVSHFAPDFKVMRGAYGNILINIEVPKALLVDAVYEDNVNITGNSIRIAAIIRTATGRNLKTKKFELSYVKDFTKDGVEYRLYQRKCPKVFTMWETVSLIETATNGLLELVINVVNWSLDENGARIEESWPSQIVPVDVYAGEYLDEGEELENPSDFELLHSQVQEESARQQEIDASLFGTDADTLGTYLLDRLIAGNKITIQKDTTNAPNNQLKISVKTIEASEVPIQKIEEILSDNVQGALEELNKRTDSKNIDSVTGIDDEMVDNADPYNPIILHDKTKADEKRVNEIEKVATQSFNVVEYNSVTGELTFTKANSEVVTIDLPLELIVNSGYYDENAQNLVLVLANQDEINIPVSDLVKDCYSKEEIATLLNDKQDKLTAGENITIDENNVISAVGGGASIPVRNFIEV
ncbi:MAG: hypothetical protein IJX25_00310 [Clostridia bacterium]|nr:hypothetical protein [Clostridia bacterium]